MSNFVVAAIAATALIPQRLVGNVTESKSGVVTIEFKEPGMVKTTTRSFKAADCAAYMAGEAGFVVALSNDPIAKFSGEHSVKNGVETIKTETGTIVINSVAGSHLTLTQVDADSKEAKAALRAGKIKVRGASKRAKAEKPAKGEKKSKKEKKAKRVKEAAAEVPEAKKKKKKKNRA